MMPSLDPHAQSVVDRVLAEENAKREHLVIALSGAHAYGFPSPDSDFDLKAVHIEPTSRLLGLASPSLTFDRMGVEEGIEIDYTSNELKPVLLGVLHGNGNYLERLLGKLLLHAAPELTDLQPLVKLALSRRLVGHYLGFATAQREAFLKDRTAKKVLYVLRTALTGTHALLSGEIETDLSVLCDPYGFPGARDLIAAKRKGERVTLGAADADHWQSEADRAIATLRDTPDRSVLPPAPPETAALALEEWLLQIRRARNVATPASPGAPAAPAPGSG